VVISADGRPETVDLVHAAGLDYLAKPVKPAALRALLSRYIPL
jgi:response regulator of citrate/malate metabolism